MTTTSRHRTEIVTLFDVFCEIAGAEASDASGSGLSPQPLVLTKYPEDYSDEAVLKNIQQFSFPCGRLSSDVDGAVQLFSFVLTDGSSQHTFGYCRYTPRTNTCLVMLTGYAWPNFFYKLLNHVSLVMNNGSQADVDALLTRVYHTEAPGVGEHLRLESLGGKHQLDVEVPDLSKLPSLKEDKFLLEFYNGVTARQMLSIYASLLKERRILFVGSKLGQLSSCVHAAGSLLYPMAWQSLFIPVLPTALREMLGAPMPYLMGVPRQILAANSLSDLGDVMIVDLDKKEINCTHDDFIALPQEVQSVLKAGFKTGIDMGDSLSRVFLRATLLLFGSYRTGLARKEGTTTVTWDRDRFLADQRPAYQAYLEPLLGKDGVQYLERFIDERLLALNTGAPIHDEFEKEAASSDGSLTATSKSRSSQVRENANDVIGALKDRVKSIEIRDKLGRLTPKEMRKVRSRSRSTKRQADHSAEAPNLPLSFDNIQWSQEQSPSSSGSVVVDLPQSASVDLIDLGDTPTSPKPPTSLPPPPIPARKATPHDFDDILNAPSRFSPVPTALTTAATTVRPPHAAPITNPFGPPSSQMFTNPFYNMIAPTPAPRPPPTAAAPSRPLPKPTPTQWERFD